MKVEIFEVECYFKKWWNKYFIYLNVDKKDGLGVYYNFFNKCKCWVNWVNDYKKEWGILDINSLYVFDLL